jgi:hypothetical protein
MGGRASHDEAAIAANIHAGQDALSGRHVSPGVAKDHVTPAAWGEGANA